MVSTGKMIAVMVIINLLWGYYTYIQDQDTTQMTTFKDDMKSVEDTQSNQHTNYDLFKKNDKSWTDNVLNPLKAVLGFIKFVGKMYFGFVWGMFAIEDAWEKWIYAMFGMIFLAVNTFFTINIYQLIQNKKAD